MAFEPKLEQHEKIIVLATSDFKAGHWLGVKNPPLGLNEIFLSKHPDIIERARKMLPQMQLGEEREMFQAFELREGKQELYIVKLHKSMDRPDMIYLYAYPESREWYDDEE